MCVKRSPQTFEVSVKVIFVSFIWRAICHLGSDVAVLAESYIWVVIIYFDAAKPSRFYESED